MLAPKWTKLWYEDPNGSAVDELHLKFNQIERLIAEWRKKVFISGRKATNLILMSTNTIRTWALRIFALSFQFLYVYFFTVMWSNIVVVHSTVFRIAHQLFYQFIFSSSFIPNKIVRWVCRICFFQFAYLVPDSRFCCFLLICFYFMAHVSTDSDSITNFQQYKRVFFLHLYVMHLQGSKQNIHINTLGKNEHKSDDKESETGKYMHRAWCKIVCNS